MVKALVMLIVPKGIGEYSFEMPQQLRETLTPSVAPEAAAAMTHPHPDEQFVDPTDWETEFFSESVGTTEDLFLPWDTPVPA